MGTTSSTISPSEKKPASKAWGLIVAGYSIATVALLAFLTINGESGTSSAATFGTAALLALGLLLPAAGMFQLRKGLDSIKSPSRYGFAMQAFGLIGLFIGVLLIVVVPSFSGYLLSAVFVVPAGASAIAGAVLLRRHYIDAKASNSIGIACLIFGTTLIFSGAGVILASNIAFWYLISQVQNTVYVDIGATISACGCVLAAYSYFALGNWSLGPLHAQRKMTNIKNKAGDGSLI